MKRWILPLLGASLGACAPTEPLDHSWVCSVEVQGGDKHLSKMDGCSAYLRRQGNSDALIVTLGVEHSFPYVPMHDLRLSLNPSETAGAVLPLLQDSPADPGPSTVPRGKAHLAWVHGDFEEPWHAATGQITVKQLTLTERRTDDYDDVRLTLQVDFTGANAFNEPMAGTATIRGPSAVVDGGASEAGGSDAGGPCSTLAQSFEQPYLFAAVPAMAASTWKAGDTLYVGAETFAIKCVEVAGDTRCGGSQASFDKVFVSQLPATAHPAGSPVGISPTCVQ